MKPSYIKGQVLDEMSSLNAKKTVLFPAGMYTKLLLQFDRPDNVYCICDNADELHGKYIDGIPVLSPVQLAELPDDFRVIITSQNLAHSFFNQAKKLEILDRCETIICYWEPRSAKKFYDPFTFEDRRRHFGKTLIVLAGYKEELWPIVFKRIKRFITADIDVCVMSSGKYVDKLSEICSKNKWSYLSTKVNNLSLIQNIAIKLHPNAGYIYKLDEDMFICEGFFDGLMEAFTEVESRSHYHVGIVAPVIPVNPHGAVRFMEKIGCLDEFETRFGKAYYDFETHFYTKTEETIFLWERSLPLDGLAKRFREAPFSYYICPHRFSIGAILFKRTIWEEMNGFEVKEGTGLGNDEYDFARHFLAMTHFYTYIMAENVLAGHYSFGKMSNPALLDEFYAQNLDSFDICEDDS